MRSGVACGAECNQVLLGIIVGMTPKLFVVNFQVRHCAARCRKGSPYRCKRASGGVGILNNGWKQSRFTTLPNRGGEHEGWPAAAEQGCVPARSEVKLRHTLPVVLSLESKWLLRD